MTAFFLRALLTVAAMVVPPMTEAELRQKADVVVDARVVQQEVHALGGRIFTFSTLIAGQGSEARSYLVALPGGVVDGIAQRVPGAPVLEVGARYRLYLGTATGPKVPGKSIPSRGVIGFYRGAFLLDDAGHATPFTEDGAPALELR